MENNILTEIFVDDGDRRDFFFISIPINERECISFDWALKGQRIISQRLKEEVSVPEGSPTGEWDTIVIRDGKYIRTEHVKWYDQGKEDWANGEVWETTQEWPLDKITAQNLLKYSLIVRDHCKELKDYSKDMKDFTDLLKKLVQKVVNHEK